MKQLRMKLKLDLSQNNHDWMFYCILGDICYQMSLKYEKCCTVSSCKVQQHNPVFVMKSPEDLKFLMQFP